MPQESEYQQGLRLFYLKRYGEAVEVLTRASEADDVKSQHFLAMMYENGNGVERDLPRAAHWYRRAAELGDMVAQLTYAAICLLGNKGVEADYPAACHWALLSLRQGNKRAAQTLQIARAQAKADAAAAVEAFKAAHQAGDKSEALAQLNRAAECGDADAQFALAQLLLGGRGVAEDRSAARLWLQDAAEKGHEAAIRQLAAWTDTEVDQSVHSVDNTENDGAESITEPTAGEIDL